MTRSFLPEKIIFVPADAQQIKQAEIIRQHVATLDKARHPRVTNLWRNHIHSVNCFRIHLWRNGGVYRSPLEAIRRACNRLFGSRMRTLRR